MRIIATTNRDLDEWVARRSVSASDLYYRLNVLPVARAAAARAGRETFAELVQCFLEAGGAVATCVRNDPEGRAVRDGTC